MLFYCLLIEWKTPVNTPPTSQPPIKTPTHTTHSTPQTQPIMKHTSVIALPTKICKQYEVGGGQYDG